MARLLVFDCSSLLRLSDIVRSDDLNELLESLTLEAEKGRIGFPRAVVNDLKVLARDELITVWSIGVGRAVRAFTPDYNCIADMMDLVVSLGFDEGVENPDGSEPSVIHAAAIAHYWHSTNKEVCVVSEDIGTAPLRPTMEELCTAGGCPMIRTRAALLELGLGDFLG